MTIIYYGIPGANLAKFGDGDGHKPAQPLPIRWDLAQHGAFAWGHLTVGTKQVPAHVHGAAQLALALCAHALADDDRAMALYQRFKMRAMDKWKADEPWSITVEEIAAICDQIEVDAKATEKERLAADRDRPPIESETGGTDFGKGGVKWHTDEKGRQIEIDE
jgi:hypothetical protein